VILKNNLQICQATLEDIPFLIPLLKQLFCIEKDFTFDAKKHAQGIEELIKNNSSYVFIGKFENEIIAMITIQTLISSVAGSKSALIEDFVVSEEYHHLGVGTQLFNHIKQFSIENNFKRLQLVCDDNNPNAKAFYTKKLFKESNLKAWYSSLE
jgi:GNAT superfamily N-acetyltransferase